MFAWLRKLFGIPPKNMRQIMVRFSRWEDFQIAWVGDDDIYYATWNYPGARPGNFPIGLAQNGRGIILKKGLCGTGKPYPGFEWKELDEKGGGRHA